MQRIIIKADRGQTELWKELDRIVAIKGFFGFGDNEYGWLSNFYPCKVPIRIKRPEFTREIVFPNTEAAFHAFKLCEDPFNPTMYECDRMQEFADKCTTPGKAKRMGRDIPLDVDAWNNIRCDIMFSVNKAKYDNNLDLKGKLLSTGHAYLEETNDWGDRYWGVDGTGENNLGRILMTLREIYQA